MAFWIVELRDSDGNDCRITDCLVEGADADEAGGKVLDSYMADHPDDETDGGFGTYHPCDCRCRHDQPLGDCVNPVCDPSDWNCEHGGALVGSKDGGVDGPFVTHKEAKAARAIYHNFVDLT